MKFNAPGRVETFEMGTEAIDRGMLKGGDYERSDKHKQMQGLWCGNCLDKNAVREDDAV